MLSFLAFSLAAPLAAAEEPTSAPMGASESADEADVSSIYTVATDDERHHGSVEVYGQLQTWITAMDQDTSVQADPVSYGDPEADPGFTIARARLGVAGIVPVADRLHDQQIDWALSFGINSPYDALSESDTDIQLVDAFGRWQTGVSKRLSTNISVGVQRVPLSRESMMSSSQLVFQERGVHTNWMGTGRQAGVLLAEELALGDGPDTATLLLRAGFFNGSNNLFIDNDPGLTTSVRAEFMKGDSYLSYSRNLQTAFGGGIALVMDNALAQNTSQMAADVMARYKWITFMGEAIQTVRTAGDGEDVAPGLLGQNTQLGAMGQLSVYVPTGESGVEFATRLSTFDDNVGETDAGDVAIIHGGLTWREALPFTDVGVGYIHRSENPSRNNDTVRLWIQLRPSHKIAQ